MNVIKGKRKKYREEANKAEVKAQEYIDKAKWAEGEANTLKLEREKVLLLIKVLGTLLIQ